MSDFSPWGHGPLIIFIVIFRKSEKAIKAAPIKKEVKKNVYIGISR